MRRNLVFLWVVSVFVLLTRSPKLEAGIMLGDQIDFDVGITELDVGPWNYNDYSNKIMVFDYYASWCTPCYWTLPEIYTAVQQFSDDEVVFATIHSGRADPSRGIPYARDVTNYLESGGFDRPLFSFEPANSDGLTEYRGGPDAIHLLDHQPEWVDTLYAQIIDKPYVSMPLTFVVDRGGILAYRSYGVGHYNDVVSLLDDLGATRNAAVPEPSSLAMFGLGTCIAGLSCTHRRRRRAMAQV
ncbi:MAG TPA: hypothetical protein DCY79_18895 [Planctomycetaceae bacterium]|nr:hypothetical protein [Blastopirellula sp.]HAY81876.1 hypothetical protein [Planctomycetaceae bacterium]